MNIKNRNHLIARGISLILLLLTLVLIGRPAEAGFFDKLKELLSSSDEQSEPAEAGREALTRDDISAGLKDALRVGAEAVVDQLGKQDGFNLDPAVHIELPHSLDKVRSALDKVGMSSVFDDLELGLNRAAEVAVPKSRELLLQAVSDLTLEDVMEIYKGPDDAATQYFRSRMSEPLAEEMRPIVVESLGEVGATDLYDKAIDSYNSQESDLSSYVLDKGIDGIFHYLAQEEAAIRHDPVKRSTEILKKVFRGF
jgi:hypothetical protein